jgi:hypothetical protein
MCVVWSTIHLLFIPTWNKEGSHAVNLNTLKCTVWSCFAKILLWRFTFTTLVQSDRVLPTCGASLSQLKRSFFTSSSFLVCMCFFFFYFSAVLLSSLWFFHPWRPTKERKEENIKTIGITFFLYVSWTHGLGLLQQNKKWFDWYFYSISCVIFSMPNSLN